MRCLTLSGTSRPYDEAITPMSWLSPLPSRVPVLALAALVLAGRADGQRIAVARFDERDGLPQSQVTSIATDADGFLWVATKNGGLARFDGTTFRRAEASEGFPARIVGPLLADPDGSLWAGTANGLYVRRARGGRFFRVSEDPVDVLARGAGTELWAGGPRGLTRFRPDGARLRVARLGGRPVTALAFDGTRLLAGHADGLADVTAGVHFADGLAVHCLLPHAGSVLAGTSVGLFRVEGRRATRVDAPLPEPRVDALLVDARGRVWAGTPRGATRLAPDLATADLAQRDGLPAVRILSLAPGEGGAIWLGGDGAGLFRFAPSRFAVVGAEAGLAETIPLSLAAAPDGTLWVTTARGEIARLVDGRFVLFGPRDGLPATDRFRDLALSPDGRLDATFAGGLARRGRDGEPFRVLRFPGAERPTGLALAGGETWIGTSDGLRVVRGERIVPASDVLLGRTPVTALAADAGGGLLAAAAGNVYELDVGSGAARPLIAVGRLLRGEAIWALARAPDGAVWAASVAGALRIDRDRSVRVLDASNGLPDDSVDAIGFTPDGSVWLSTDAGLARLGAAGSVRRVYGFADGLPAREGIVRSVARDRAGRLWFGFVGALLRYDPAGEEESPPPPRVHVESVRLPDRAAGEEEVEVDLSVIEFADARGIRLSWRLAPVDAAFRRPQESRTARWASLRPGSYRLEARAVDRGGRAGPPASVDVVLPPLWYETRTARAVFVLLLLGAGMLLPSALRTGSAVVSRLQAQALFAIRSVLAPAFRPIDDDPFAPGTPAPPLLLAEGVESLRTLLSRAWQGQAVVLLAAAPGAGKSSFLASLEAGALGAPYVALRIPAARGEARLSALRAALLKRGLVLPISEGGSDTDGRSALVRALAALSEELTARGTTLLLLEDDPGAFSPAAARARAALATAVLSAAPRISLVVARDVTPSTFAVEEPDLVRVASFLALRVATPDEAGAWLEQVAGERARFAPGASRLVAAELGSEPALLRAFGSALLAELGARRTNGVTAGLARDLLDRWDVTPPPVLAARWASLSGGERIVGAALAELDRGRGGPHAVGEVVARLSTLRPDLGPVEVGALVARLAEASIVTRDADRIAFRSPLLARFVHRHRPLSEEQAATAGVLGAYELLEPLGAGGMGMVYRARRLDSRTEVAVKVVHPHLLSTTETRRRFLREGEIGIRLSHPGLVKVFERGEANGRAYLAMEYVPGPTIRELLGRRGPLPLHLATRIARDVADAVASMHALGIVHRDLKNENVIVAAGGHPKLLDFGLARLTEGTRFTQSGHALGTPDYMAPEQVQGDLPTLATDVWALGAGLYEMLTGRLPFGRADAVSTFRAILDARPVPPHEIRAEIPESLELIVLRALEKDPAERWPSAVALRDALSAALPSLQVEAGEEDFLVVRALQTERTDDWGVLGAGDGVGPDEAA